MRQRYKCYRNGSIFKNVMDDSKLHWKVMNFHFYEYHYYSKICLHPFFFFKLIFYNLGYTYVLYLVYFIVTGGCLLTMTSQNMCPASRPAGRANSVTLCHAPTGVQPSHGHWGWKPGNRRFSTRWIDRWNPQVLRMALDVPTRKHVPVALCHAQATWVRTRATPGVWQLTEGGGVPDGPSRGRTGSCSNCQKWRTQWVASIYDTLSVSRRLSEFRSLLQPKVAYLLYVPVSGGPARPSLSGVTLMWLSHV